MCASDAVEPVEPVDPVDPVESGRPAWSGEAVGPGERVEHAERVEPGGSGARVGPGEPAACVELVGAGELAELTAGLYRRGSEEFSRFTGFSDGIFGFAMTLLISTVAIPVVSARELGGALRDQTPDLLAFFVSFVVIGFYWLSHHRLFAAFGAVTTRIMRLNLVYMALIAFLPFPTALFGRYTDAPVSVVLYALALSVASLVEVVILRDARRAGLVRVPLPDAAYRSVVAAALVPVGVFALSTLVALVEVGWAPFVWILIAPAEAVVARRAPVEARLFG